MGSSSYDRDVYSSSSSSGWSGSSSGGSSRRSSGNFGASSYSASRFTCDSLHYSMNPKNKIIKSTSKSPIIILLDVTGSNIEFARVVYDKLPMFYGQIEQKGYLEDFDICFCAVGDAYTDEYPLQVSDFAKGIKLDSILERVVLEGMGGGQRMESYELAAYYLYKNFEFDENANPLIFFIGDEAPYQYVNSSQAVKFGLDCSSNTVEPFSLLREKVNDNVFMLLNKYCSSSFAADITGRWQDVLAPEHVIKIQEEKSIIDLILGIISMTSFARDLDSYKDDMQDRGQTAKRIANVSESLSGLDYTIKAAAANNRKSPQKGKRI